MTAEHREGSQCSGSSLLSSESSHGAPSSTLTSDAAEQSASSPVVGLAANEVGAFIAKRDAEFEARLSGLTIEPDVSSCDELGRSIFGALTDCPSMSIDKQADFVARALWPAITTRSVAVSSEAVAWRERLVSQGGSAGEWLLLREEPSPVGGLPKGVTSEVQALGVISDRPTAAVNRNALIEVIATGIDGEWRDHEIADRVLSLLNQARKPEGTEPVGWASQWVGQDGQTETCLHTDKHEAHDNAKWMEGRSFAVYARPAHEAGEVKRMRAALEKIERWFGEFPETGRFWTNEDGSESDRPMSYSALYGSNGERDFMRSVARAALEDKS